MPRIRSIKPTFFKSSKLYDLEVESGLPVRLAFEGLWCCSDRDGRFKWCPRELKTDILPYDDVDFAATMEALASKRFIIKYEADGETYGCIRNWSEHQVVNSREAKSLLPPPPVTANAVQLPVITVVERKGKERKGKEVESASQDAETPNELSQEEQKQIMSHYNRVSGVFRDVFRRCEPKTSYLWKRLKEEYPDEREAQTAARAWADDHEGDYITSPLAAFLGEAHDYQVDRGSVGVSPLVKEKAKELSNKVSKHTNGDVAFNDRQQRNLREACEQYSVDLLFSAFKRYWEKQDAMSVKFAAKNFSETALALGAAETKIAERAASDKAALAQADEISAKIRSEMETDELEDEKLVDESVAF